MKPTNLKRYKIKIQHQETITAENEQEAIEIFWDNQIYQQHNIDNFIDEITQITEIKKPNLKKTP